MSYQNDIKQFNIYSAFDMFTSVYFGEDIRSVDPNVDPKIKQFVSDVCLFLELSLTLLPALFTQKLVE